MEKGEILKMSVGDILLIVTIVVVAVFGGLYYFNKKRMGNMIKNIKYNR